MYKKFFGSIKSGCVSGARVTLRVENKLGISGVISLSAVGSARKYIRPDVTLDITTDEGGSYSIILLSGIRFDVEGVLAGGEQIVETIAPMILEEVAPVEAALFVA